MYVYVMTHPLLTHLGNNNTISNQIFVSNVSRYGYITVLLVFFETQGIFKCKRQASEQQKKRRS